MKIIHLIDYFQPKIGYQETFLAKEHEKQGHDVAVVTSDRYYPFVDYRDTYQHLLGKRKIKNGIFLEEGIKTIRLRSLEASFAPVIYLQDLSREIKELNPDLVICHGMFSLTSYRISLFKKRNKFKLIYDTHAAYFNTSFDTFFKKAYLSLFRKVAVKSMLYSANHIFAIGNEEKDFICNALNIPIERVKIVRLGVDCKRFRFDKNQREKLRKKLGIEKKDIVFVFAGKVEPRKNLEMLFSSVKKLPPEVKIMIIGNGKTSHIKELKKILPKKRVIWIDYVENKKLPGYFSACDIAVWPGDPAITMLEAMACRLPLITPRTKWTNYLDASQAVKRFLSNNKEKLMETIKEFTYNKKIRINMGYKAEKYIKNHLCWKYIAEKFISES